MYSLTLNVFPRIISVCEFNLKEKRVFAYAQQFPHPSILRKLCSLPKNRFSRGRLYSGVCIYLVYFLSPSYVQCRTR